MGVRTRKGYVHALEGVIAALIVVVYLNSIVSVPPTTDWETTSISKESEDLLSALDRSGFLDTVVLRDDSRSFTAFVSTLSSSLSYSIKVTGLPKAFIDVGVMANNGSTRTSSTQPGDWGGAGLPSSEDSRYRRGTLNSPGFNGLRFVLSDVTGNGIMDFGSVNLDFDGDGNFGESGEGPHNFSDRFFCDSVLSGCSVSEDYGVGSFNTTLVIYNASTASFLAGRKPGTSIGGREVVFSYETVNPFHEPLDRFDVLWVEDWLEDEIDDYDADFQDFLGAGRMVLIHSPVVKSDIDDNYLYQLGFDYINHYSVSGSGTTTNVLYSVHGPRNESYRSSQYLLDSGIRVGGLTDQGGYDEGTVEIRNTDMTVRSWDDSVSLGSESFAVNHSVGSTVSIQGNSYLVDSVDPLILGPSGRQGFESFGTERIDADYHVTRMEGRAYNITDFDTSAQFSQEFQSRGDLPPDYDDGPVNTPCDPSLDPYKLGDVVVESTTYKFLLVNFEPTTPCDIYSEFVYFDLNGDGDFDDDNMPGSSREGPYQVGDEANVSGSPYRVSPHLDGEGLDLERLGPRLVGEIPVSTNVYGEGGSAAIVRRQPLGHDDLHLLASLMARETQEKQDFTRRRSLGETSLGYTYSSSAGQENSFGYSLETVWWFQ